MGYDYKKTYEKSAAFYAARPWAKRTLVLVNYALTWLFIAVYAALVVYAWWAKSGAWKIGAVIGFPVLCLCFVGVLRRLIPRPRPYSEAGANIRPFIQKEGNDNKSFPSRHLASAFVIASAFLPLLPWLSGVLYALGCVLGYARFALGLHYPSDLLGGAVLGLLCGLPIFWLF
ncbi:MAG: phosphatase PAP2 family protein [Clostridia bacterium]|nr:phosphatase PAP2 family protein [Clostridia bacterium]